MKHNRVLLTVAAVTALGALVACDYTAPATPQPTPGPVARSSALNGTYNLLQGDCGEVDKSLVIDGNRFIFPNAACTVANSEKQVSQTQVTLACEGSAAGGNRIVNLQTGRDGRLRLTEGTTTLTYYQCTSAQASSGAMFDQRM